MEEMLKLILDKLNGIESRLDRIDSRLDHVEQRLDRVEQRLDKVEQRLDHMEQENERRFTRLEVAIHEINKDVKDIKHQIIVDNSYYDKKFIALEKEVIKLNNILESKGLV